jgi:hypothetical protein
MQVRCGQSHPGKPYVGARGVRARSTRGMDVSRRRVFALSESQTHAGFSAYRARPGLIYRSTVRNSDSKAMLPVRALRSWRSLTCHSILQPPQYPSITYKNNSFSNLKVALTPTSPEACPHTADTFTPLLFLSAPPFYMLNHGSQISTVPAAQSADSA